MLLTYKVKHGRNLGIELAKAKEVAEYAIEHRTRSSADVKYIGLKSMIANQVLRKYGNDNKARAVKNVVLIVPGQGIKYDSRTRIITVPCLKLKLDTSYLPSFDKVNQIELNHEFAFVTVAVNESPLRKVGQWVGVDLNSTGHIAVVGNPSTGRRLRLDEDDLRIPRIYSWECQTSKSTVIDGSLSLTCIM